MKNRFVRVLMVVLAFALVAVGHSGCGGGGNNTSPTAPSTTPMPTPHY